jgi:hypothetical protein
MELGESLVQTDSRVETWELRTHSQRHRDPWRTTVAELWPYWHHSCALLSLGNLQLADRTKVSLQYYDRRQFRASTVEVCFQSWESFSDDFTEVTPAHRD